WRQKIQDYLVAAIQNVRILLAYQNPKRSAAIAAAASSAFNRRVFALNFLQGLTADAAVTVNHPILRNLTNAFLRPLLQNASLQPDLGIRPFRSDPRVTRIICAAGISSPVSGLPVSAGGVMRKPCTISSRQPKNFSLGLFARYD